MSTLTTDVPAAAAVAGVEHWTTKGDVRLYLWNKVVGSPDGKPCVLFVHGSSMASTPTFDLQVPGRGDSSASLCFRRRGSASRITTRESPLTQLSKWAWSDSSPTGRST